VHHHKNNPVLPQLLTDSQSTSEGESPRITKFWKTFNGICRRNGMYTALMTCADLKMMTTPKRIELKDIVHQMTDSRGLVWQEKERGDVVYAIAHTSARVPGTNWIRPKATPA